MATLERLIAVNRDELSAEPDRERRISPLERRGV